MLLFFYLTAILVILIYIYIIKPLNHWKKRGIKYVPGLPLIGNAINQVLKRKQFGETLIELYNKYPKERYVGIFQFTTPALMIRDLELLNDIAITDFDHFADHFGGEDLEKVDLLGKSLFMLGGTRWKKMRATLSPTFTTSKIKSMFQLMDTCGERLMKYLEKKDSDRGVVMELEMKDFFSRVATDVIASCAFGHDCNSLEDTKNTFFLSGKTASNFTGFRGIKILLAFFAPKILKFFNMPMIPKPIAKFFQNMVQTTIKYRLETDLVRPDMINLMLEANRGRIKHEVADKEIQETGFATVEESSLGKEKTNLKLSDDDMAAQALVFFFAGFNSVSTLLSFLTYELAMNKKIQERLRAEIDQNIAKQGKKFSYEMVTGMKYMDMVVSEGLRKWSIALQINRACRKDFLVEPKVPGEKPFLIEKGTFILIPICAYHYDPKYFIDPQRFDPERFNYENREKIVQNSYIPFGIGPRNCIGLPKLTDNTRKLFDVVP